MISISEVCVFIHSKCTCTYPVKRGFLDSVHVCGSQQFPQLFVGDVYGISELIEKIGVEVDTILKVTGKAFDPSLYCLPRITILWQVSFHNTSKRNRWKLWKFSIINWVQSWRFEHYYPSWERMMKGKRLKHQVWYF